MLEAAQTTRQLAQATKALGERVCKHPTLEGSGTSESPGFRMPTLTRGVEWDSVPEHDRAELSSTEERDANAIFELGLVERDHGELPSSERLFRQAAERGNADAMFELSMIERERGDLSSAERWLRQAALAVRERQSRD
jgi:TPR repeat protein